MFFCLTALEDLDILKPDICGITIIVGHRCNYTITRETIIDLCNELTVDVEIDGMLLRYDGQLVGLVVSLLDC